MRLKQMDSISTQIYLAVEKWYAHELELRHHKANWYRKAFYYTWCTGHFSTELFARQKPELALERYRVGKDLMDFVTLKCDASQRHSGSKGIKTFEIPVFFDSIINREEKTSVFVESQMWSIITDSWAFNPYVLDLSEIGNHPIEMLNARCKGIKLKARIGGQVADVPVRPRDLRALRIYDLLANRSEYFAGNPLIVGNIVGLADMQWLMKSAPMKLALSYSDVGHVFSAIKKYSGSSPVPEPASP